MQSWPQIYELKQKCYADGQKNGIPVRDDVAWSMSEHSPGQLVFLSLSKLNTSPSRVSICFTRPNVALRYDLRRSTTPLLRYGLRKHNSGFCKLLFHQTAQFRYDCSLNISVAMKAKPLILYAIKAKALITE